MPQDTSVRQPIVLGAKTRLARELVSQFEVDSGSWSKSLLVARSKDELLQLVTTFPTCDVRTFDQLPSTLSQKRVAPVVIFWCALGPLHPRQQPQPLADLLTSRQELECFRSLLGELQHDNVHVLFVSSVLAVSSGVNRYYYSGWKRGLDAAINLIVGEFPNMHVSVVHPGRLVECKSVAVPASWLSTSYRRAARIILRLGRGGCARRIIGIDARLHLMMRSAVALWTAVTGDVR